MFKIIVLAKRKPGLTPEQFRDLFEKHHIELIERFTADGRLPEIVDYRRNYLLPSQPHNTVEPSELGYDVIIDVTYRDIADFQVTRDLYASDPEYVQALKEDYERIMAPDGVRYIVVEERSGLSRGPRS